jgi:hypothetical protein
VQALWPGQLKQNDSDKVRKGKAHMGDDVVAIVTKNCQNKFLDFSAVKEKNSRGLSPRANYTDRATAAVSEVSANFFG